MRKLIVLLAALTVSFAAPSYAEDTSGIAVAAAEQVVSAGDVHVSVNGLVCDFCARALEKVFGKEEAVSAIDVNLDTKVVTITFNNGQSMHDERIAELITDAGYNVEAIHHGQ